MRGSDPLWGGVMDWLADVGVGEPAAVAVAGIVAALTPLVAADALADGRAGRLREGVAEIAAAHADVRDDLEELLWP